MKMKKEKGRGNEKEVVGKKRGSEQWSLNKGNLIWEMKE